MVYMIIGGSGSGKSAYAENILSFLSDVEEKYYLATMQVSDKDGENRVKKHRELRQGKGFITVEKPRDISQALNVIKDRETAVLVECISNLVANEMFAESVCPAENVVEKIARDINDLKRSVKHLLIVTNNVFEDGILYEEGSMEYMEALGEVNRILAQDADEVVEVAAGLPVLLKERREHEAH